MINTLRYRRFSATAWFWGMVLVVAPLFYVVIISLMSRGPYGGIVWNLTLDNYSRIFEPGVREILLMSLARSVGLAFLTTLFCVLVGFPLALFLVYRGGKWRSALFFLLIIPFWTNFLIRTYAWMVLLSDNGWLNHILEKLGMGPQALHLLFTPQAVLIGMLYNYLPSMTMSLYVSVEKMDPKLLDAAADLGAGPMKRFF
jgi:spermidine/putrescine transport system permease protein